MAFHTTEELNFLLPGKIIESVKCYNVNNDLLIFNPKGHAMIDGGVEIQLNDLTLSIGWSPELELFDVTANPISTLLKKLDFYQIDTKQLEIGSDLVGLKIISCSTKWNWYKDLNDDFEPIGNKHYILNELILTLENGRTFQLATINYKLDNNGIQDVTFDSQGELMLSADTIIPIQSLED